MDGYKTTRLLYVEDDLNDALLFRKAVERADPERRIELIHFTRSYDALAYALQHDVDGYIFDYNIPGMNGDELLSALRSTPAGREKKAIVATNEPDNLLRFQDDRRNAREKGRTVVTTKEDLRANVKHHLGRLLAA